jgi:hypothetical protein
MLPTKFQFIWPRGFRGEDQMWKVNGRRTPSDDKSSHCLWQGQPKIKCYTILYLFSAHNRHMKLFSVWTKYLTSAHNMNIQLRIKSIYTFFQRCLCCLSYRFLQWRRLHLLIFFTEVIKFYWLMLLLYPGELYRLLGASSFKLIFQCSHKSFVIFMYAFECLIFPQLLNNKNVFNCSLRNSLRDLI